MITMMKKAPSELTSVGRLVQTLAKDGAARGAFAASQGWGGRDASAITAILERVDGPLDIEKAAVAGISVQALPGNLLVGELIDALRARSAMAQIRGARIVPPGARVVGVGTRPSAYLLNEGAPVPVSGLAFTSVTLLPNRVASLAVFTDEALRATSPAAQASIADVMLRAVARRADEAFLQVPGSPAIASTGSSVAAIDADIGAALSVLDGLGADLGSAQWVLSTRLAARLALLRGSGGALAYPELRADGTGTLAGFPAITTSAEASTTAGHTLTLINGAGVALTDPSLDQIEISKSQNAALQLLDNPSNSSAPASPQTLVSMLQTDTSAVRAVWRTAWYVAPDSCVRILGIAL